MFIECKLQKPFPAPEERNKVDLAASSPKNHCAPLERERGIHHGIYKHSAPPEPACYLVAACCMTREFLNHFRSKRDKTKGTVVSRALFSRSFVSSGRPNGS
jgi:hypothetical protein